MRLTYLRRRLGTPVGRREAWRWGLAIVWMVLVVVLAVMLWRRDWLVSEWSHVQAAWEVVTDGQVSVQLVSLVITVALVMCLPSLVMAMRLSVRLRPWRPHSGGMNLANPAVRLFPPGAETWRLISQQRLLERFADGDLAAPAASITAPVLLEGPTPPPPSDSEESDKDAPPRGTPVPATEGTVFSDENGASPPTPEASEPTGRRDEPPAEKSQAELESLVSTPDNEVVAAGENAVSNMASTTLVLPAKKPSPAGPEVKIFRLFNKNPNMLEKRASVVLLFAMHNEAIESADVAQVCRIRRDRLRSLLWRLDKEGWLQRAGKAKYKWGKHATTDLGLLIGAVKTGNEEAATTVAATMRSPLPGLDADWIDSEMWTLRHSLRAAAAETLEVARERWPNNQVFASALDNITDRAQEAHE